jgi:RHS repeat-associated protein
LPAALSAAYTPSAGALPGAFSVSPGGQATYRIPIAVPPGRLGMEPSLAVSYDSSAGDGPLGVGFSVQGLSAITRCPANLAQDGYIAPVRYDTKDHFCLDGLRLVPVAPTPGDGPGTLEYRTFPDTFSKIVARFSNGLLGPASFEVLTKAGHVLQYGAAPNSQAMAQGSVVAAWWLSTEQDRRGNAVDYTYLNDADPGDGHTLEILPLRIDYTRNGTTAASNAVVFDYAGVTPSWLYGGGLSHTRSRLLVDIQTLLEPGDEVVRGYAFAYAPGPGTQRRVLQSVTECDGLAGPCNPPTTFSWSGQAASFTKAVTAPLIPKGWTSTIGDDARWVLADVNGDGLDDLVIVNHIDETTDQWVVALNAGGSFGPAETWATLPHPASAGMIPEIWTLTPVDYDQDGRTDIFIDSPNPLSASMPQYRWLRSVPDGPPGQKFELHDTGVAHPNGVYYDPSYDLPAMVTAHRFARLGDVNGDGIADLIQCFNPTWSEGGHHPSLGSPRWTVNPWVPSLPGSGAPGFDPTPVPIPALDALDCAAGFNEVYVIDVDGDGVSEILAPQVDQFFGAFRYENGGWLQIQTNLALPTSPRLVHFLDLNGDGLTDAVYSGYYYNCDSSNGCPELPPVGGLPNGLPFDVPTQTINDGKNFGLVGQTLNKSLFPPNSLPGAVGFPSWGGATDWWGDQAIALDYNGDGRMDLALPISSQCPGSSPTDPPCWVILQTNPGIAGAFSQGSEPATDFATPISTHIPTVLDWQGNLLPWFLPQVTDVDGNGTHDLVVPNPDDDGSFIVYRNGGAQDLLVAVTDGMNPLDPQDPGFVPTVSIQYGNLVDAAITQGLSETSAKAEPFTYLSRFDPGNGCQYPRACVVGPQRVVRSFQRNDGQNQARTFALGYRDARYHRLGRGSLGFGERFLFDLDAGSGSAERYDNVTWDATFSVFPFAGQVVEGVTWSPASATQPAPTQIELTRTSAMLQQVFTDAGQIVSSGAATYFTLPVIVQRWQQEGSFKAGPEQTLLQWVAATEATPATVLRHVTSTVSDYDGYGNVLAQDQIADGVDLHDMLARQVKNDASSWLVGLVESETACSSTSVAGQQCRVTKRTYDVYGEVASAALGDPTDPGTQLTLGYERDTFGNVSRVVAADAFGHVRATCTSYEPQGIFPYAMRNTLGHTVLTGYDPAFGVVTGSVDVNGLVTQRAYDGFGRLAEEIRPDGTWTVVSVSRTKDGGPKGNWWSSKITTQDVGGAVDVTELDGAGRPVRASRQSTAITSCGASICAPSPVIEQDTQYDLFGHPVRVSGPWLRGDALSGKYADTYAYDAAGRVTGHTDPWGRVTTYGYAVNVTSATDWLGKSLTVADPLGRTIVTSDKNGGATTITYGPFSAPSAVTRFGAETTTTQRDAYGRVLHEDDPDRGETHVTYDGFGEPLTMADALGRTHAFTYDGIGRLVERDDHDPSGTLTTTWTFDTAPHGIGRVAVVESPANHVDTYTYDPLSRPSTHTLALGNTAETFGSTLDYDSLGRLWHVGYPTATGVTPLVVRREYDSFGRLVALHDDSAKETFWQLQQLDGAGRATVETLGNGVRVQHAYLPDSGLLQHVGASLWQPKKAEVTLQDLSYTYDAGLRMTGRTDGLQPGLFVGLTETFTHDALDRLTCASLSNGSVRHGPPSCENAIAYQPNGNIAAKGPATYGYDPDHPHAVSTAGSASFSYDAVGNQVTRPGVSAIAYTPFDLPSAYTLTDGTVTLDYDGDQHRIRKTTAAAETVYFDELYERESNAAIGTQEHRYYVAAGSSLVVLTRSLGATDAVAYLLTEALGSVDVVTDGGAGVVQRRSYDAFGARRDSAWGQSQSSFTSAVSPTGFAGLEGDDELGLVNMRGRIYDPALARFLTTDPLVTRPGFSQSWNPYSYVWNSPLGFTDPSGFGPGDLEGQDGKIYATLPWDRVTPGPGMQLNLALQTPAAPPTQTRDAARDDAPPASPAPTPAAEPSRAGNAARDAWNVYLGAATGANRYLYPNPVPYVKALTGATLVENVRKGAHDGDVSGAVADTLNTVNPLYQIPVAAIEVDRKANAGDIKGATADAVQAGLGVVPLVVGGVLARGGAGRVEVTKGSQVTEGLIRDAMKDAPLVSQQAGGVSLRLVQQYVDKLLAGEVAPAIKIDGNIVVDGNHRYIAGRILGKEPATQPWAGGRGPTVPWSDILISTEW